MVNITSYGDFDAWQRHALVSIDDGTYNVLLHGKTSSINLEIGERSVDIIELLNMGQIMKFGPIGMTTITFEGFTMEAGTSEATGSAATGFWDIFAYKPTRYLTSGTDTDLGEPQEIPITNEVTRYRVSILFTNDSSATAGSGGVTSGTGYKGLRFVLSDCAATSNPYDFTDSTLKSSLVFKGRAFSASASALIQLESGHDTTPILALGTYAPGSSYF